VVFGKGAPGRSDKKGETQCRFAPSVLLPERLRRASCAARRCPFGGPVASTSRGPLSRC